MNYKTTIKIEGRCVDDIMRLACVRSCEKTSVAGIYKFRFYPLAMAHPSPAQEAVTGDTLAEDYEDRWHVLRNNVEL